jgi:hypothetical protein
MAERVEIWKCGNGHYFLQRAAEKCPRCGERVVDRYDYREGDCISCGALCGGQAYCCDQPRPVTPHDLELMKIADAAAAFASASGEASDVRVVGVATVTVAANQEWAVAELEAPGLDAIQVVLQDVDGVWQGVAAGTSIDGRELGIPPAVSEWLW